MIGTLEASSPALAPVKNASSGCMEGTQKVMFADSLLPQLAGIARRAEPHGVDVAWVELKPQGRRWVFRVFIERVQHEGYKEHKRHNRDDEDGVGLEDCQRVAERLSLLLDVEDPIESSYTLEVSSPGLDRPLHGPKDYERFVGKLARVKTKQAIGGRRRFIGRLLGLEPTKQDKKQGDDPTILLDGEAGPIRIRFSAIESARLEVELNQPSPRKARKRA